MFVDAPILTARTRRPIPEPYDTSFGNLIRWNGTIANVRWAKPGKVSSSTSIRRQLAEADRADLARKVRWVSAEDGDGAGYDVLSFDRSGCARLIEVKTTNGSARTPFYLSRNERDLAEERPADWRIYRVHLFAKEPHVFTIAPPLETSVNLRPETWRASF